jgi:hypothetical protein
MVEGILPWLADCETEVHVGLLHSTHVCLIAPDSLVGDSK